MRTYTLPQSLCVGYSPAQAVAVVFNEATAWTTDDVLRAVLGVLTESQQERVLQELGWQLVPPPPVEAAPPSPAPVRHARGTPFISGRYLMPTDADPHPHALCRRQGGCLCGGDTPGVRATCEQWYGG